MHLSSARSRSPKGLGRVRLGPAFLLAERAAPPQPAHPPPCLDFVRGLAFTASAADAPGCAHLCAGTSQGEVFVFEVAVAAATASGAGGAAHDTPAIRAAARLAGAHGEGRAVTALGSAFQSRRGGALCELEGGGELVSADDGGRVVVWARGAAGGGSAGYAVAATLEDGGAAAAGVGVRRGLVVVARVDGTVRIYGLVRGAQAWVRRIALGQGGLDGAARRARSRRAGNIRLANPSIRLQSTPPLQLPQFWKELARPVLNSRRGTGPNNPSNPPETARRAAALRGRSALALALRARHPPAAGRVCRGGRGLHGLRLDAAGRGLRRRRRRRGGGCRRGAHGSGTPRAAAVGGGGQLRADRRRVVR